MTSSTEPAQSEWYPTCKYLLFVVIHCPIMPCKEWNNVCTVVLNCSFTHSSSSWKFSFCKLCDMNPQLTHNSAFTPLTHWGRVTHICVGILTIIGSDDGLSPGRRQAIIWTNVGILLIRPLGTSFSEILIGIYTFSFKKMLLKTSSAKWRPFCLGLNVLIQLTLALCFRMYR